MNTALVYLDASALVRLVQKERESVALWEWLSDRHECLSSALAAVEVRRAVRRAGAGDAVLGIAEAVLGRLTLVRVDEEVLALASRLPGRDLRTLDAIHVATALSLGDLPGAFVTYDRRLAAAAARHGLSVVHPGAEPLE